MRWQTKQIELPISFGIYSLEHILSKKQNFDYVVSVNEVSRFLEETKRISDYEELKERLDDIKEKIDDLKDELDNNSSLESHITSLNPEKKGLLQSSISPIFDEDKKSLNYDELRNSKYFVQILRADNQRNFFGFDISDYTFIAEPFNKKTQLVNLIDSVEIPREYHDKVLGVFEKVKKGTPEQIGDFAIVSEERYHPVISKFTSGIKYATVSSGVVIGTTGGLVVGAGAGTLIGGGGILVGLTGGLISLAGLVVGAGSLFAGGVYGASKGVQLGAQLGFKLEDKITENNK